MSYKHLVLSALLPAMLLAAGASQAQLYRWTDDDGRTVVSDTPPPPHLKHQLIRKSAKAESDSAGKEKSGINPSKPDEQESAECALARKNLQALESDRPLTVTNAKGENILMDAATRGSELAKVRERLRSCKN